MIRATTLAGFIVILFSPPAPAQSVDRAADGLEVCFRQARLADKTCEALTVPGERLDCLKKTRDTQLECLTHTLPDERATSTAPSQASPPPPASPKETENNPPENTGTSGPAKLSKNAGSDEGGPSKADAEPDASRKPATSSEAAVAVQPVPPTITNAAPALPARRWVISETTSPVDYSPLVSAVMEAGQPGDNGPNSLTIRCRAKRTELLLQFAGNPTPPKPGESQIYFQVEDQSPVKQDWNLSPDGKIATLKNDVVSLLQSLPDGARLKIWTARTTQQGSAFQLAGLGAVRKRVAAACNWLPQQVQTSTKKK